MAASGNKPEAVFRGITYLSVLAKRDGFVIMVILRTKADDCQKTLCWLK